jgi:hypothetical protein
MIEIGRELRDQDGAEAVIMGCAGMALPTAARWRPPGPDRANTLGRRREPMPDNRASPSPRAPMRDVRSFATALSNNSVAMCVFNPGALRVQTVRGPQSKSGAEDPWSSADVLPVHQRHAAYPAYRCRDR